ncbi:MAG: aldo/keto reductase family oxidoreductase, partial [Spirochaetaceae bacterium]
YQWPRGDIHTTRLIYGCMKLGGSWDESPITDDVRRKAFAALDAAVEAGITIFDHADIYCRGKSETVFGEYLREHPGLRDRVVLQSKCGIRFPEEPGDEYSYGAPVRYDFSYDHIMRSVDGILSRLGVDTIDILLLHRPDSLVEPEEVARAFDRLKSDGKVGAFGVSNHSAAQMALLESVLDQPLVANQMQVSLMHPDMLVSGTAVNQRRPEHVMRPADSLEYCRQHGVQLQAWSPLAQGYLTGREFPKNWSGDDKARAAKAAGLVERMAGDHGVSREAIALGWILRHPAPVLPVVGTTDPGRIAAAAEADTVELSREEWYLLVEAARGMSMP